MKEKLKLILYECSAANNIDHQQSLKDLLLELKNISFDLGLDFDLALDKSEYIEATAEDCDHAKGFPCKGGGVFCPSCNKFIIEGETQVQDYTWLKKNIWRSDDPVVPS